MPVVLSKVLTKKINFDLSNLVQWLWANKIVLLNVNKTDIVIFHSSRKQVTKKNELPFEWSKNQQKHALTI